MKYSKGYTLADFVNETKLAVKNMSDNWTCNLSEDEIEIVLDYEVNRWQDIFANWVREKVKEELLK